MSIKHAFTSPIAEGSDPTKVGPNEWNAVHVDQRVDAETPAGAVNGTNGTDGNTVFTLTHAPSPAGSLLLVHNGLIQFPGVDFILAGTTITYLPGSVPLTGDLHRAWYKYDV